MCDASPQEEFYYITGSSFHKPFLKYLKAHIQSPLPDVQKQGRKRVGGRSRMGNYFKNANYFTTSFFVKYHLFNHGSPNCGQNSCLRPLMKKKKKSMKVSASTAKKLNRFLLKFVILCKSLQP